MLLDNTENPYKTTYHINLETAIGNTREVYLSELVEAIRYVPLETTTEYMIGEKSVKVKPCAEYIFISEHGKTIGVFDLDGNFIRTIGNIGKGPKEYNFDYDFWPDETTRNVYVSNVNIKGITAFSFDGKYIEDIIPAEHSMTFVPLGNDKFISWTWQQKTHDEKLFRLFFHDNQGRVFDRVFEPVKEYDFSHGISIMSPHFTYAPIGVIYNSWEEDQIMRAQEDGSFETALTWNLGKYKIPFEPSSDYKRYKREKHKYIMDLNAWESHDNWYIKYHYKNRLNLAVLDKTSEDFYIVANPDTAQDGLYNDIDGGPSFWPFWYSDKGKRFFELFQAIDLIEGDLAQKPGLEIKNPEAALAFNEMVAKLNENSNPVLMIVEMK